MSLFTNFSTFLENNTVNKLVNKINVDNLKTIIICIFVMIIIFLISNYNNKPLLVINIFKNMYVKIIITIILCIFSLNYDIKASIILFITIFVIYLMLNELKINSKINSNINKEDIYDNISINDMKQFEDIKKDDTTNLSINDINKYSDIDTKQELFNTKYKDIFDARDFIEKK